MTTIVVLVAGSAVDTASGATAASSLAADVEACLAGLAETITAIGTEGAVRAAESVVADDGLVPVVFVGPAPDGTPDIDRLLELHADPALSRSRFVIVTSGVALQGVDRGLQAGAIHGMLSSPWTHNGLQRQLTASLATFLVEHAPEQFDRFGALFGPEERGRALERIAQRRRAVSSTPEETHLLLNSAVSDNEIEERMIRLLDEALGHPPRLRVAPGTVLIEEGSDVGGIYLIREGVVRLTSSGQRVLHERSTGAIVGLLSLAEHRHAMLTCTALTEVQAIPVTLDQLARALDSDPELGNLLTRVLITSLARRLRRSDELQLELDRSLAELAEARAQLVAQARFATLGEMAAGLAHELNNPAAALIRLLDHLRGDVLSVITDEQLRSAYENQWDTTPSTPAEARARRRELTDALGDRLLAERLVAVGIADPGQARRLLADGGLERREATARVVDGIRAGEGAIKQIATLVDSLRSYARGDDGRGLLMEGVDVWEGVHNAIRLLSHRLNEIEVRTEGSDVPALRARPGALQQVWTNLLTNAVDASPAGSVISVTVDQPDPRQIRVRVADEGKGIPPEIHDRVFEPRFTTKEGRVQFNLGLGLSISRQIVHDHGGTIEVDSQPGHTVFTVLLPIGGPE